MFFYSLMSLFVGGLNTTPFIKAFFATFTLLSILVLTVVTIYGEGDVSNKITQKLSLTNCCWTLVIVLALSMISLLYRIIIDVFSFIFWPIVILLSVVLPYTAFFIFMMIIRKRLVGLNSELDKEVAAFDGECKKVEGHIHQLKEAYELSVSMESGQAGTEQQIEE